VVVGIGIDLIEVARVRRSLERWGDRLIRKLMDPEEAALLPEELARRAEAVALAITAKEAASKAIGTGWSRGVRWRDIVVRRDPTARVELLARAAEFAYRLGSDGSNRARLELRDGVAIGEVWLLA
jgi:holo-[acyl-carrier protein] synthase